MCYVSKIHPYILFPFFPGENKKKDYCGKKEKPAFHAIPFSLETSLLLLLIFSGILFNPVSAKVYSNYTPQFFVGNESPMKVSTPANITYEFDKSVFTPEEAKLTTDLQILLFPEKDPTVTPTRINSTLRSLRRSNLYKLPGELLYEDKKNGTAVIAKTDMVYVDIAVTSGNSTHILDSYLYPPIKRQEDIIGLYSVWGGNSVYAWVELSQVMNIANISTVRQISPTYYGSYNKGSITTEGDGIHHSDFARYRVNDIRFTSRNHSVDRDPDTPKALDTT